MRNFIFEDMCERSDTDRDDPSVYSLGTKNHSCEIMDLRQLLKDKMSKNEIFYSFEIVSVKMPSLFYQRFVIRVVVTEIELFFFNFYTNNVIIRVILN